MMMMNTSEPLCPNQGVVHGTERRKQLGIAYDPVLRNAQDSDSTMILLNNEDYRQLRKDKDRRDKEAYENNMHARDEDEWDFKMYHLNGGVKSSETDTSDEEAEQYMDTFPDLAERLFQTLGMIKEYSNETGTLTQDDIQHLNTSFCCMAQVFQTEKIGLDQRISRLVREAHDFEACVRCLKISMKSAVSSLKEISEEISEYDDFPSSYPFLEVISLLENNARDFELYWTAMTSTAKRLGRLQVQKQLHKILNIMMFKIRVIRSTNDNYQNNINQLQIKLDRAKKLLQDNNIHFDSETSTSENQLLHNRRKSSQICHDILRFIPKLQCKKSTCFADAYDYLRRELYWPWSCKVTIRGLKQNISILLMIIGIVVYIWRFFPYILPFTLKLFHYII